MGDQCNDEEAEDTYRIMRIQSPKTGTNSGDTCDIEGWALAKRTSSATSMGPGILRADKPSPCCTDCDLHQ